jgi:hypothetical protein
MSKTAQVRGPVEYRLGDGPLQRVPPGEVEIELGPNDVTLSWGHGDTRESTAMPSSDFARYLASRSIVVTSS